MICTHSTVSNIACGCISVTASDSLVQKTVTLAWRPIATSNRMLRIGFYVHGLRFYANDGWAGLSSQDMMGFSPSPYGPEMASEEVTETYKVPVIALADFDGRLQFDLPDPSWRRLPLRPHAHTWCIYHNVVHTRGRGRRDLAAVSICPRAHDCGMRWIAHLGVSLQRGACPEHASD